MKLLVLTLVLIVEMVAKHHAKPKGTCMNGEATVQPDERYVSIDCTGICTCNDGVPECVSLCPPADVTCRHDETLEDYLEPVTGSKCTCKRQRCVSNVSNDTDPKELSFSAIQIGIYQVVGCGNCKPCFEECMQCVPCIGKETSECSECSECDQCMPCLKCFDYENTSLVPSNADDDDEDKKVDV